MTAVICLQSEKARDQLAMLVASMGLPVHFAPLWCRSTTVAFLTRDFTDPFGVLNKLRLVFFSETALLYALGGVRWHDDSYHCNTWSDGCRCDLGDEA